jgi:2-dehydro-3-deoxygluconokinase
VSKAVGFRPHRREGQVVTVGEALLAIIPTEPVPFEDALQLRAVVGGAEVNFAVGLAQRGIPVAWVGHLGDDPPGRRVLAALCNSGVDTRHVRVWPTERTGIYLRDWLPDGQRRPTYYRRNSAARRLSPEHWPPPMAEPLRWLHVTGITAALGPGPRKLVEHAAAHARAVGATVSFDPNFRPVLWPAREARPTLRALAGLSDVVLMSEEDAEVMLGTTDPLHALTALEDLGVPLGVLKRGEQGAVVLDRDTLVEQPAVAVSVAVDPVGAGDAFNAGFVAGLLDGKPVSTALRLGAEAGAIAVEHAGEHPADCRTVNDVLNERETG